MQAGILARGPWRPDQVEVRWLGEEFRPAPEVADAADAEVAALRRRGSPAHDGAAARLASFEANGDRLALALQPCRWALRLVEGPGKSNSLTALCVVRSADGRWLAGRRAGWLASWPGRWALGAGGAIEVGENPVETLTRELEEEWSLTPERLTVEALLRLSSGMTIVMGLAMVAADARAVPDAEHDDLAWWPAAVDDWPAEADEPLRRMGLLLEDGTLG